MPTRVGEKEKVMIANRIQFQSIVASAAIVAIGLLAATPACAQSIGIAIPEPYEGIEPTKLVIIGEPTESAIDASEWALCVLIGEDVVPVQRAVAIRPGQPAQIVDVVVGQLDPLPVGTRITVSGGWRGGYSSHFLYANSGLMECFEVCGEID